MTKICGKCGKKKPIEGGFYMVKRARRDGSIRRYPRAWCKECEKKRIKGVKERNPDLKTWRPKNAEQRERIRAYQREYYRICYGKGSHTWKKYRVKPGSPRDRSRIDAADLIKWFDLRPWIIDQLSQSDRRALLHIRESGTVTEEMADSLLTAVGEPDQLHAILGGEAA